MPRPHFLKTKKNMSSILSLVIILTTTFFPFIASQGSPPSPGYYPSSRFRNVSFNQEFMNLWGPQHQSLDQQGLLSIWLDTTSGSGFKSIHPYRTGYFGVSVKLQPGYTAGVLTSFYLSNNEAYPGHHDEIDIEFLGTTSNEPYTLQTNVYIEGSGDGNGNRIGRELQFHLWFDPTQDFHNYAVLWNPNEIIFLVDDVPIRWYQNRGDATFPTRPMWVYGSIWDASSWATDGGKYKADYRYQPFVGRYDNFKVDGCASDGSSGSCKYASVSPSGGSGLSRQQYETLQWVQRNYKVYDYCSDPTKNHKLTPEC